MRIERFEDIEAWQLAPELTRKVNERKVTLNGELRTWRKPHGGAGQGRPESRGKHDQPTVSEQYQFRGGAQGKNAKCAQHPAGLALLAERGVEPDYADHCTGDLTAGILPRPGSREWLGDINFTAFFSPAKPGKWIWGVGPVFLLPTATDDVLGTEKWGTGPSAVVLTVQGPWVYGALINQIWSFAGDDDRADVDQMLIQPFVNYNLPDGWYLSSGPMITANWEADSDNTLTIPLGGGGGKIFRIGKQPVNASVQAFYNVEKPDNGPDWTLRLQLQFLFPKSK